MARRSKSPIPAEHVVVDNPQFFNGTNYRGATIDWIAARSRTVVQAGAPEPHYWKPDAAIDIQPVRQLFCNLICIFAAGIASAQHLMMASDD